MKREYDEDDRVQRLALRGIGIMIVAFILAKLPIGFRISECLTAFNFLWPMVT